MAAIIEKDAITIDSNIEPSLVDSEGRFIPYIKRNEDQIYTTLIKNMKIHRMLLGIRNPKRKDEQS